MECQEGSVWEGAQGACAYGLDNLTVIIDRNRIQKMDFIEHITGPDDLGGRFAAFGWDVKDCDGHDEGALKAALTGNWEIGKPRCLIARTVKGKGYAPAEAEPDRFHGVGSFDPETGKALTSSGENFSNVFGGELCRLAEKNDRLCAVTAAMCPGTGLTGFSKQFPERFFDVGIAEGHAVTMCAGMAKQGMIPVFAVYSTFLQRAYDMLLHDVALQNLHVVFCVDRAGVVGEDGETHHGVFDVGFLDTIPGMTVLAPANYAELHSMLEYAVYEVKGPVALRYPRGGEGDYGEPWDGQSVTVLRPGRDVTLAGYGTQVDALLAAAELLEKGRTHVKDLYSQKTGRTFAADLLMTAEDGRANFSLEFPKKKGSGKSGKGSGKQK